MEVRVRWMISLMAAHAESGVRDLEPGSHPGALDPVAQWIDGGPDAALSVTIPSSWQGETWSVLVEWTLDAGAAQWSWSGDAQALAPGDGISLAPFVPDAVLHLLPPGAQAAELDLRAHVWVDAWDASEGAHAMRYSLPSAFVRWEEEQPRFRLEPTWLGAAELAGVVLPPGVDPARVLARVVPAVEGVWPPELEDTGLIGGAP